VSPLQGLLASHPRWVALTGAGLSAGSGIPTYRNDRGEWQRSDPIQHQQFIQQEGARRRYWARSMAGWTYVAASRPNEAHRALARLEALGHIPLLATQNVDRLHQAAGHRQVVDLHGRLDRVRCLTCAALYPRNAVQQQLLALNPFLDRPASAARPDGDADLDESAVDSVQVPSCASCAGTLMPDVVFFGGSIPTARLHSVDQALRNAGGLLVVGSSLQVYSGYRCCRQIREQGKPLYIINPGQTRADALADLRLRAGAEEALPALAQMLARRPAAAAMMDAQHG
jgi:NAD-dependent SIR2 family protein deacetylase